jgi:hypothetical protein
MSNYENAWNMLKIALISTEQELKEAASKPNTEVENLPTQMRMLYKLMYLINDLEEKTGIQGTQITP